MKTEPTKRGGKREGAGRKPSAAGVKQRREVFLSRTASEWLDANGGNRRASELLEAAILNDRLQQMMKKPLTDEEVREAQDRAIEEYGFDNPVFNP